MTFDEWFEKHSYTLLGKRMMASMDYLIKLGKPLFDDAQPQWEPIETAPKSKSSDDDDIETVLLYVSHNHQNWGYAVVGFWNPDTQCWCNNVDGGQETPTHWMPMLPLPIGDE